MYVFCQHLASNQSVAKLCIGLHLPFIVHEVTVIWLILIAHGGFVTFSIVIDSVFEIKRVNRSLL